MLVLGGAHSGKSEWAEHLARSHSGAVIYVATGAADLADADWQARLRRHRQRRPANWALVECGAALPAALERTRGEPLRLVDALGTWVSALLHHGDHHWQQQVELLLLHLPPRCGTQQKLAAEKRPVIGINWQGNPRTETTSLKGRSLPLESLASIASSTAGTMLSLQKGPGEEQRPGCSFHHHFVACQVEVNHTWNLVETAAMIANCNAVITTSTVVAHLAAAQQCSPASRQFRGQLATQRR